MIDVKVGMLCCRRIAAQWRVAAPDLGRFETLVAAVETAEMTLLGVATAATATAAGVLGVRRAPPAMTA